MNLFIILCSINDASTNFASNRLSFVLIVLLIWLLPWFRLLSALTREFSLNLLLLLLGVLANVNMSCLHSSVVEDLFVKFINFSIRVLYFSGVCLILFMCLIFLLYA